MPRAANISKSLESMANEVEHPSLPDLAFNLALAPWPTHQRSHRFAQDLGAPYHPLSEV